MEKTPPFQSSGTSLPELVSGIANHEAKSLLVARMALSVKDSFSALQLWDELVLAQGDDPEWIPGKAIPPNYADHSLIPIGAAVKERVIGSNNRYRNEYFLSDSGRTYGLAMSGIALKWSLQNPSISVQHIFGVTNTHGKTRSPEHRLAIMQNLVGSDTGSLSYKDLEELNPELPNIREVLTSMQTGHASDIYNIVTDMHEYNPLLSIGDPEYTGIKPLHSLKPERQAIYRTLFDLKNKYGINTITANELVDAVTGGNAGIDARKVRNIIFQGAGSERSGLRPLSFANGGRGGLSEKQSSSVSINPEYIEPLSTLTDMLSSIADSSKQQLFRQSALEIAGDVSAVNLLMKKAYESSSRTRVDREDRSVADSLLTVLSGRGPLSVNEIYEEYKSKNFINVTSATIRFNLNRLFEEGVVDRISQSDTLNGRSKRVNKYKLK